MAKPMYQIVQMGENDLSAHTDIRVVSQRNKKLYPSTNLMLSEKDKYDTISLADYQGMYDLMKEWDSYDMVQFSLQWPEDKIISITRWFFEDAPEMPIVEYVVHSEGPDSEPQGQIYARQDVLATYKTFKAAREKAKLAPNVKATSDFIYDLFMHQDLSWEDVVNSFSYSMKVKSLLLNKTTKGVENFVRSKSTRNQVKFIIDTFAPEHKVNSMLTTTDYAIRCALNSLVDTIAEQAYGRVNDDTVTKVLSADVHLNSLGLVVSDNQERLKEELVYAVVKSDSLYLTFGALDLSDAINDLRIEFDLTDEEVTEKSVKVIKLIYPNLV